MKHPVLIGAASVVLFTASLFAADAIKLDGIKCVMNARNDAKAGKSVDYKGGQVFFCCDNCPKAFATKIKSGDELVAAKANAQLVATKQAKQSKCPLTGQPCKPAHTVKVAGGATVAFCCPNCKGKVAELEGDKQLLTVLSDAAYKKAGFKVAKKEK